MLEVSLCSSNDSVLVHMITFLQLYQHYHLCLCRNLEKSVSRLRKLNHALEGLDKKVLELRTKYIHAKLTMICYNFVLFFGIQI